MFYKEKEKKISIKKAKLMTIDVIFFRYCLSGTDQKELKKPWLMPDSQERKLILAALSQ